MPKPTDRAIAQAFFAVLSDPSVSWKNEPAKKFLDAVADLAGKIDADAAGSTTVEQNRDAIANAMASLSSRYDSPKFKFDLLTAMLQAAPAGAQEPAGRVFTIVACVPGATVQYHVELLRKLPHGTLLYTAPPAASEDAAMLDWLSDRDNAAEIGVYGNVAGDLRSRIKAARGGEGVG